jgi:hypothetical protein
LLCADIVLLVTTLDILTEQQIVRHFALQNRILFAKMDIMGLPTLNSVFVTIFAFVDHRITKSNRRHTGTFSTSANASLLSFIQELPKREELRSCINTSLRLEALGQKIETAGRVENVNFYFSVSASHFLYDKISMH